YSSAPHRDLHSFPTRRSSDLAAVQEVAAALRDQLHAAACASDRSVVQRCLHVYLTDALRRWDGYIREIVQRDIVTIDSINLIVRSEEHTSELQSLRHLVCRLL